MKLVTIKAQSQREHQIVAAFGQTDWSVLVESNSAICFDGAAAILVRKERHTRWIRRDQVKEQDNGT
jgi:hypothetical protein